MIKLLIVDDDVMVRLRLKAILNNNPHKKYSIQEAKDGLEAFELAQKVFPDIIITDIKMPRMNGLELIEALLSKNSHAKFLVISNYDDFSLVKQAMKLGAQDYLLKLTLNDEELFGTLNSLEHQLEKTTENNAPYAKNIPLIRRHFLSEMISSQDDNLYYNFIEVKDFLEIDISAHDIGCVVISLDEEKNNISLESFIDVTEEIIQDTEDIKGYCFSKNSYEYIVILSAKSGNYFAVKEFCVRLKSVVDTYYNICSSYCFGGLVDDIGKISFSFNTAMLLLQLRKIEPEKYYFDNILLVKMQPIKNTNLWNNNFCRDMEARFNANFVLLKTDFDKAVKNDFNNLASRIEMLEYCILFYCWCCKVLLVKKYSAHQILQKRYRKISELDFKLSEDEITKWFNELVEDFHSFSYESDSLHDENLPQVVKTAVEYIEKNFNKNITLQDVADYIYLNPNYFSKLFSNSLHTGFSEYLINLRIEKSKELLKSSNQKIYQIAETVGYVNSHYFNRIFKQKTGMTPLEFRNK